MCKNLLRLKLTQSYDNMAFKQKGEIMAIAIEKDEQLEKLQNLWMSGDLDRLERSIDKFNIFTALKLDNAEIRHSNFLAWLMNPRESHDLGDYFLKEFLKTAIKGFLQDERIEIKPQDILNRRFYECEIRREDNNIDILIINPETKFVCLIENKVWSGEHSQQLERYAQYVKKQFKGYKKLHIFLTPEPGTDNAVLERGEAFYIQMGYEQVVEAIEKTLKHRGHIVSDDIRIFIEHYKKMIERNIMNKIDKDVMDFCRGLYQNHKDAIDLINRCTDGISTEIAEIIKEIIENQCAVKTNNGSTTYFLPQNATLKYGKDKNWLDGNIVGLYFGKSEDNNGFDFGISVQTAEAPDNPKRNELINALENEFGKLKGRDEYWRWLPLTTVITIDKFCELENPADAKRYIEQETMGLVDKFNNVINKVTAS